MDFLGGVGSKVLFQFSSLKMSAKIQKEVAINGQRSFKQFYGGEEERISCYSFLTLGLLNSFSSDS